jgi:broad-specificity NMP kinase
MSDFMEILKYVLPSLVVLVAVLYLSAKYFASEQRKLRHQEVLNNQNMITPLRLQAYERVVIFLERISPENLIMRVNKQGYSCKKLQTEMLNTIRSEYEHNLSQQIYVSHAAWEMTKSARGQTIQLINITAGKLQQDAPSIQLSKAILESVLAQDKEACTEAIRAIKKEISQLF